MKTKEQILEWLDKQPWKNELFKAYFLSEGKRSSFDESFIVNAFAWDKNSSAEQVWKLRNIEYLKWYNSNDKPMSWEEYLKKSHPIQNASLKVHAYIGNDTDFLQCGMSKELCEAFVAYMKLIQLRNAWVKDYKCYNKDIRYRIISHNGDIVVIDMLYGSRGLSFADEKDAQEFLDTFKDLLETAKPLL